MKPYYFSKVNFIDYFSGKTLKSLEVTNLESQYSNNMLETTFFKDDLEVITVSNATFKNVLPHFMEFTGVLNKKLVKVLCWF